MVMACSARQCGEGQLQNSGVFGQVLGAAAGDVGDERWLDGQTFVRLSPAELAPPSPWYRKSP